MNKTGKQILYAGLYLVVFILIQFFVQIVIVGGYMLFKHLPLADLRTVIAENTAVTIASTIISSLITIALFLVLGWTSKSRDYLSSRPWTTLMWVVLAAIGIIIPASGLEELFKVDMPEQLEVLFTRMMHEPLGYVAIGILGPLAEEIVFRGAILRTLLKLFGSKPWIAIAISAAVFGIVHGNSAQFLHAFLLGLLLGWMFYRTGSIVPGVVLHWVNNTIVYVMANLMPGFENATLSQLANGKPVVIALYIFFSLCILVPALVQLNKRLARAKM